MALLRRIKTVPLVLITLLCASWLVAFQCESTVVETSKSNEVRYAPAVAGDAANQDAASLLRKLPLHFEQHHRPSANGSRFIARAGALDFSIFPTEVEMHLRAGEQSSETFRHATSAGIAEIPEPDAARTSATRPQTASLQMQLVDGNRRARLTGENQLTSHTNYFIGNDPQQWRSDVPNYARVKAEQIYRGVDVVYYGSGGQLEYDFNVAPGATFKAIRLRFRGAQRVAIDQSGALVIDTAAGQLRQHQPVAYQLVDGKQRKIGAGYILRGNCEIGFDIGAYDRSQSLIIDPVLSYSTFFGGEGNDFIYAVAVDAQGNAYVAGTTDSSDLAITPGAFQSSGGRSSLAVGFIAKFNPNSQLLYSTYLGGSPGPTGDFASSGCLAIAVDSTGNAYITGWTGANFPVTANAFQRVLAGGTDAFVAKLNTTGSALVYSTYLGSSKASVSYFSPVDEGLGIAVDEAGSAYVTGRTMGMDFPVTAGVLKQVHDHDFAFEGDVDPVQVSFTDAFITKLNPTGTALVYSTYLGGGGEDFGSDIKVDAAGNAYVVGTTRARDFPTSNSPQANLGGGSDAFITKVNQVGSGLIYSTYVGGTSDDTGNAIAIDESGNVYFAGTTSSTDLQVTAGAFQPASADVSIYKSTNSGASWALSNVGMPGNSSVGGIVIDPASPSSLYAAVFGRVFSSTDGGRHWKGTFPVGTLNVRITSVLSFDPKKPTTVYGVRDLGIFLPQLFRSFDAGQTWRGFGSFSPTAPQPIHRFFSLTVDPVNKTTIYVTTDQGLFKTTDDGNTWIERGNGLPDNGGFATSLVIDPKNPDRLLASASGELFTSTNGGKRWETNSLSGTTIFSVTFDPVTASTVYASGAGLFKSTDSGENWQEVDNDLPTFGVGKLVIDPSNPLIFYTTVRGGVFKSTDGGRHWIASNDGLGPHFLGLNGSRVSLSIDPRSPSILFAQGNAAGSDAFVGKLNSSGSAFVYLSYLGGTGIDTGAGLMIDRAGSVYITGQSGSNDFPVSRAFQPDKSFPGADVFITKLRPDGAGLDYSSYLGGSLQDYSNGIDVDLFGNAYVVGYSLSPDFPLVHQLRSAFRVTEGFLSRIADPAFSQPAPTISNVSPSIGSSGGLYAITILGANFLPEARVRIGGVFAAIAEVTSNRISGIVNGRSTGWIEPVDLVVSNPDGQSTVLKNGFTFLPLPRISGVTVRGKELIVSGDGFDKGSVVLVNGTPQKTRLDVSGYIDYILLLSKKAAKKIARGQTAVIQVTNVYGLTSAPVSFTRDVD